MIVAADRDSYRQIVKSTAIIGGATFGSILIGLVRTKLFAILLGPTGIGLLGLFQSFVQAASSASQVGLNVSGVVLLGKRAGQHHEAAQARGAMWLLSWVAATGGGLLVWAFRSPIAKLVMGTEIYSREIGWLGLAVCLAVLAASAVAVLQGYRRISDMARTTVWGALTSTVIGVLLVYALRHRGIVPALIAIPAATILFAQLFGRGLPRVHWASLCLRELLPLWAFLLRMGFVLWGAALAGAASQAIARAMIAREAGLGGVGIFHAAWGVSATHLTLLLAAMGADYYPRMTAVADDAAKATKLAHQQLEVALLLGAPLLVAVSASAPLVIVALYSREFVSAAGLLQWHLLGDALRLVGWTFGIVLLSRNDARFYFVGEVGFAILYLAIILLLFPSIGLTATGVAYVCAYSIYSSYFVVVCWKRHKIGGRTGPYPILAGTLCLLALLLFASSWSRQIALWFGIAVLVPLSFHSHRRLLHLSAAGSASKALAMVLRRPFK